MQTIEPDRPPFIHGLGRACRVRNGGVVHVFYPHGHSNGNAAHFQIADAELEHQAGRAGHQRRRKDRLRDGGVRKADRGTTDLGPCIAKGVAIRIEAG